jgi:TonB family protein
MSNSDRQRSANPGDILLWSGCAVLALVAVAWLLVARPWAPTPAWVAGPDTTPELPTPSTGIGSGSSAGSGIGTGRAAAEDDIGNPLRMAELAYDAGMLLEPAAYSAWALYQRALQLDPDNPLALAGLTRVADDLVTRGTIAVEQGRVDDARLLVSRVVAILPNHGGARSLQLIMEAAEASELAARERTESRPPEPFSPAIAATATPLDINGGAGADQTDGPDQAAGTADAAQAVDRIVAEFSDALADQRLLAPQDGSAKFHLSRLMVSAPLDERTAEAGRRLFQALMQRAGEAVALLDADAAGLWLDEAEQLGVDARAVGALREELIERLVSAESTRPVPVSTLTLLSYTPPAYPVRALDRLIEGWVDLEFTVDTQGRTVDVVVTDGSHDAYFRYEAVRAVEQWRFEPREFLGRRIPQRSYTRLRFAIED